MTFFDTRIVDLPGKQPARVDVDVVVCVRVEANPELPHVIVHTSEGFAFPLIPEENQEILAFYKEVLSLIWPESDEKPKKQRRSG